MAVSLEARTPLLDHKLIEFVTRIPASLKLHAGETKYIFKRAIADFVPSEILHRSKQGFGLPIQQWINEQLREQIRSTLTDNRARGRGYVEQDYVAQLLADTNAAGVITRHRFGLCLCLNCGIESLLMMPAPPLASRPKHYRWQ